MNILEQVADLNVGRTGPSTNQVATDNRETEPDNLQPSGLLDREALKGKFSLQNVLRSAYHSGPELPEDSTPAVVDPIQLGLLNVTMAKSLFEKSVAAAHASFGALLIDHQFHGDSQSVHLPTGSMSAHVRIRPQKVCILAKRHSCCVLQISRYFPVWKAVPPRPESIYRLLPSWLQVNRNCPGNPNPHLLEGATRYPSIHLFGIRYSNVF